MTQHEFLAHVTIDATGIEPQDLARLRDAEARRATELAEAGILRRLWRLPEGWSNYGLWRASSVEDLHWHLATLPLFPWMTISVQQLSPHPNDPGEPA